MVVKTFKPSARLANHVKCYYYLENSDDIVVEAIGPSGAVVTFSATAVDDTDGNVPVTLTPASGSTLS